MEERCDWGVDLSEGNLKLPYGGVLHNELRQQHCTLGDQHEQIDNDQGNFQSLVTTSESKTMETSSSYQQEGCDVPNVIEGLTELVANSDILFFLGASLGVLGLDTELVMECGIDIDMDHLATLQYLS